MKTTIEYDRSIRISNDIIEDACPVIDPESDNGVVYLVDRTNTCLDIEDIPLNTVKRIIFEND